MELTSGSLQSISEGIDIYNPVVKVLDLKEINEKIRSRYILKVFDGSTSTSVILATQLNKKVESKEVQIDSVIRLDKYTLQSKNDKKVAVILELTVLDENQMIYPSEEKKRTLDIGVPVKSFEKKPLMSSNVGNTMPINIINSYQNKWTIQGRVIQKSAIKTWNNARGDGKLFNFILCDSTSDIKIVAFNNEAAKFFDLIEIGKTYSVSKGTVKMANVNYKTTKSEFEISLNNESVICEVEDTTEIPKMQMQFVPIDKIAEVSPDSVIDVLGIAHSIMETSSVISKTTNRESVKREVTLVDRSGASIRLTLWGNDVNLLNDQDHPVVAIRGAIVKDFNGRSLSGGFSSTVMVNPTDIPEAVTLAGWYIESGSTVNFQGQQGSSGSSQFQSKISTISELNCSSNSERAEYFNVEASISQFRRENFVYKACKTEKCNKKLHDLGNGLYRCDKCGTESPDYSYRLILNMNLMDYTGACWVTCFQESSQIVLGRTAEEIGTMIDLEKKNQLDEMFSAALFRTFEVKVRARNETYNDETRMKVAAIEAKPIDVLGAITRKINAIKI